MTPEEPNGLYYDGRTAHRESVGVEHITTGIRFAREDGTTVEWPFGELRCVPGLHAGERLRIERVSDPPEAVVVLDESVAASFREVPPEAWHQMSVPRTIAHTRRRTALIIGVAMLAMFVAYVWGVPALADAVAPRLPLAWEEQIGRAALEQMAPAIVRCDEAPADVAIRKILQRLLAAAPANPYAFTATVVDDSVVNAFAAPGGFIVINRGLLQATTSPEELAGVLAHEVEHVLRHHSLRAMAREIPVQIVLSAIAGGSGGITAFAARTAGSLGALRYRRSDELEADTLGLRLIQAARIDPRGMIEFYRKLSTMGASEPKFARYFSTHPQSADRVAVLEKLAAERKDAAIALDIGEPWSEVQRSNCRR